MAVQTPIGILSFPVLFSPKPRGPGQEPDYSCAILFDEQAQKDPKYAALKQAVAAKIDETWGPGKSKDAAFCKTLKLPFKRCEEKSYAGYDIPNGVYITPWTKSKPGVIDARKQDVYMPEDVWAGQLVRASVQPFSYTTPNKGVSLGLNNLQICRTDGPRIDGRKKAAEEFGEYTEDGAAVLVDDDSPF